MPAEALAGAYEQCRLLHQRHGRTYYRATRLLPAWKRRHVHALYGFARYADEIVDSFDAITDADRAMLLQAWSDAFAAGLAGTPVDDPVLPAVLHTIEVFQLDRADFTLFLRSMAMDLTVTRYPTYAALLAYMQGSAAAIGAMMLPVLGADDLATALEPARELGRAFQVTNFIRDVAEDYRRGRIYLPLADLIEFGVTEEAIGAAVVSGNASAKIKDLIRYEVARAETHYRAAAIGIPMLAPGSQACIRAAYRLYREILTEVARADYDVFCRRAVVPRPRQLRLAAQSLVWRNSAVPPAATP